MLMADEYYWYLELKRQDVEVVTLAYSSMVAVAAFELEEGLKVQHLLFQSIFGFLPGFVRGLSYLQWP